MKTKLLLLTLLWAGIVLGQDNSFSDRIKMERDNKLDSMKYVLAKSADIIEKLQGELSNSKGNKKIEKLDSIQKVFNERLKTLETAPKSRTNYNGQLALIELLNIQKDLKIAELFTNSNAFFTQISKTANLQDYPSFKVWQSQYNEWYKKKKEKDGMLELVNNSIGLIGNAANKIPLYGSIIQTATSGIGTLMSSFGKDHKELMKTTPAILNLLSFTSQFENQKAIIDHEWEQIEKELSELKEINGKLLEEQLLYYEIDPIQYRNEYLNETLDTKRDLFKTKCRTKINNKLASLDNDKTTNDEWLNQVETYMYQVQSLRIKFGTLTGRMSSNINQYKPLFELFSDDKKFPKELTEKIKISKEKLGSLEKSIKDNFSPEKYVEESAVMYIERNKL